MLAVENTLYVNRRTNIAGGTKCKRGRAERKASDEQTLFAV
jgi:hypothetical protein